MKEKLTNFVGQYRYLGIDFIYNIIASAILTLVSQFFVYPFLALKYNINTYGVILTILGIVNAISVTLGASLNNTRLLKNKTYEEKEYTGDFNILATAMALLSALIIYILVKFFFSISKIDTFLLAFFSFLLVLRIYLLVSFRLEIDYKKILGCNIVIVIGYLIGALITNYNFSWVSIFILGELFGIIYIKFNGNLLKEKFIITPLIKNTAIVYITLIMSNFVNNMFVYSDRILLYPILGSEHVSIYNTALIFGKTAGILLSPISGVFLTYLSTKKIIINKSKFLRLNFMILIFSLFYYLIILIFGRSITGIIYPNIIDKSYMYIPIVSISAVINSVSTLIQPVIFVNAPSYWQVIKEIIYGGTYLIFGIFGAFYFGLIGFAVAAIFANSLKYLTVFIVGYMYSPKEQFED